VIRSDWNQIFAPVLLGIWGLLEGQLEQAIKHKELTTSLSVGLS